MADSEAEVVAVDGGDVDMLDALERAYRVGWNSRHTGSVRTVEERDERARGVAEEILADARPLVTEVRPSGADEAFVEWQRLQPAPSPGQCTCLNLDLAPCPAHGPKGTRTVTDMVGCAHRMNSGAVSLTACGECGAQPGDDCAKPLDWHVVQSLSDDPQPEAEQQTDTEDEDPPEVRLPASHGRTVIRRAHGTSVTVNLPEACPTCGAAPGQPCEDREQTATAPTSCTERMRRDEDPGPFRPHWEFPLVAYPCPECGSQPGQSCAAPLEDREQWALAHGKLTINDTRHRRSTPNSPERRSTAHQWLDSMGVPRHLAADDAKESGREQPCSVCGAPPGKPCEDGMLSGPVPSHEHRPSMVGVPLRAWGRKTPTDPWWRRLLHRIHSAD